MKTNTADLTGRKFGRLTVKKFVGYNSSHRATWECLCECGTQKPIVAFLLLRGTQSCGCLIREVIGARYRRHGMKGTLIYNIWAQMKGRCFNKNRDNFAGYGGSGILVCEGWSSSFETFAEAMGERPSDKHTVDRINSRGNYSCGGCDQCKANGWVMNCRWATPMMQSRNRRSNRLVTIAGETQPLIVWAERAGMSKHVLLSRLNRGMNPESAIAKPVRARRKPQTA